MATPHHFFFPCFFFFFVLSNSQNTNSSTCTLDFTRFPYEPHGDCFDTATSSASAPSTRSCCGQALQSLFQAMTVRANHSQSIFLDPSQAEACITTFQKLHNKSTNILSKCTLQDFISSSGTDLRCSRHSVNVVSYRQALQALGEGCAEALLISLASSDTDSANWVHGTFSCLWDEIKFPWSTQMDKKGSSLTWKKILAIIITVAVLVVLAPILYKVTRKRLKHASEKEIENFSVKVLKKTLEEESRIPFNSSDLYIFSQDEMAKATNYFCDSNLIGEGTLGRMYVGTMPSGMKAAILKMSEGIKLQDFTDQIYKKAKIRHPNLVSILGYCDRGDQCLVYEYCINGDLANWLFGGQGTTTLTWDQRLQISIGIAQAIRFLHNHPLEKIVHGDIELKTILLSEKLQAKLFDSILSSMYKSNDKSRAMANDVFNFGVVLFQLLTGRAFNLSSSQTKSLIEEARDAVSRGGSLNSLVDPRLNGAYIPVEFRSILSLAILCMTPYERERPNMDHVLQKLEETQILV
ncbi:probable receptor-like protein kinase At1g80640 isoform X2 [Malania oleifera]|uniref:probable receptor-like protein kinase At1g80640 isoform X2 n=1 Tax=Malania oleifera TaxID=397392 RepID=UPI0025AE2092|nr:probable receptor-like protein kinase At1g80640 isoform X2 [Malania oleifera]